jgi:ubiquinone/menaquinone biosynthesis C-methylase UbiE
MLNDITDKEWEKFGKNDAYFGVISCDKYRKLNLTEKNKKEFFESGFAYTEEVIQRVNQKIDVNFRPQRALDFGCGVGRISIPLARLAQEVIAVDVSDAMLSEARKNCQAYSIHNVNFIKSDNNLLTLKEQVDFIHSFIVFQHIPTSRGSKIFKRLLSHLDPGGVCVIHFTYASKRRHRRLRAFAKNWVPFSTNLANLLEGKSPLHPRMQMNEYNLNQIFDLIQSEQIPDCHVEFTNHNGVLGMIMYFQKPST